MSHVRDLIEGPDCVFAVGFSPDGSLVGAAGADRAARVWEVNSGKLVVTIEDHADWVLDLAISPDGKRLATASRDKTAKVFDLAKKESLATFTGHAESVQAVTFSPDGKLVVTAGGDGQVRAWNPDDDAKQVKTIGGFGGPIFRLGYVAGTKTLVACSADKTIRTFDDFNPKLTLTGHADWVYTFAIGPDGKRLASGSYDGEVRLWDLADGKPIRTILAAPGFTPKLQAAR